MSDSLAHETTDVEKAKASIENMDDEEQKQKILSTNITKIPVDNKKDKKLQKDNDDTVEMLVSESRESVETFSNRESEVKQRETKLPTSTEKHDSDTENIIRESVQSEIAQSEAPECLEDSVDTRKDPISKAQSSAQALPGIFSNKEIQTTESETEDRTSAAKQNSGTENTIRESLQSVEVSSKPQSFKKVTSEAPQFLEVSVDTQKDTISREQYFTQASPETFSNKQIEMTERETEDTASTAKQDSDTENTTLESVPSAVVSSKPQSFEVAQSEALQSLEVLVDADKDTITKDQSYIQPLPETFSNKESEITERETEFTSTAKQDSNTENITAESEQSAVVSSKPQAFEKAQSEASQSLVEVSVDAEKDTLCTQALPQISKPIKSTDVASSEAQSSETSTASTVPSTDVDYADHVTYKEDGSAIYTDPKTKYQYKWCAETNNWTPCEAPTESSSTTSDPFENEHYKWCQKTQKWIPKQTQVTETEHYKWDADKKQWIPKMKKEATQAKSSEIIYDIDEEGQRTYTDNDGTVFFWDVNKNAWFPKIDEDFMARYQMSYGFIDNTSEAEKEKEEQELNEVKRKQVELQRLTEEAKTNDEASKGSAEGVKRKAQQEPPQWFEMDPSRNTKVYISNLPLDITLDEFAELMGKCGMIMRDPLNQKFKLKLYTEADGQIKGDGLCDYIKVESVDLALKILDEYYLRGNKIRVQRAQFQMRGEYNPALKPKRKKKDKEKLAKIKEKLFDWRPEKMRGERSKHEKTVIIKNLFHPELFEKEVPLILDYQNDLREECSKCGTVKKVVIYDRHSEGVAQINMTSPEEADLVIQMMQGRFFGKRQLTAEHWDGKTKYKIDETEEEIKKRLNKWDQYLERTEAAEATKRTSD